MKKMITLALIALCFNAFGQDNNPDREIYLRPSYWRPYDKRGINVFETNKTPDSIPFDGLRFRIGAGFTQQFQNLEHETKSTQPLYSMGPGFDLAMANLFIDVQLADGIRLNLTNYLSTRHHNETWVKGGYIQFDKLPFKGQFWNNLMNVLTVKIGHMEINYGDQHFRRSDAGHTLYNPFIENYIADAFSTEIGAEVYAQKNGIFGMVGVTNGTINSSINTQTPEISGDSTKNPAIYFKAGIDKSISPRLRGRLSASAYINNKSQRNVLYAGDRGGSNYWGVLEPKGASLTTNFTSGRFTPNFTRNVHAYMFNGFLKAGGLELFGTYETSSGNAETALDPDKRTMNQFAVEGVYRFGPKENVYLGGRYNTLDAELPGYTNKVNINRTAIAAGWFLTRNVLLKGEWVTQKYKDFAPTLIGTATSTAPDPRYGGKFHGYVVEAVVGF